ncbi:MAG TPA: hypothetical protein DHW22_04010 [Planctomycetaceae bacterium]|nr:hypothetical protein [Planctomycetaceae bacterium]
MATRGFLGIDAGTQGLSVVFTDEQMNVIASGESDYEMVEGLPEGCYEQTPSDWEAALQKSMQQLFSALPSEHAEIDVLCVGVSAQMHGEVLADLNEVSLGSARLWCDSRNEPEGDELTNLFKTKVPKRATSARWLWTMRNQKERAEQVAHLTTPAGWISHCLTGLWTLGIGDAAGMFPMDQDTLDYNQNLLDIFDRNFSDDRITQLKKILPVVRRAGQDAGMLNARGAELLGLPEGIPVAPAEGDQPAALAGSLIGEPGMVSVSFGTSVCANSVGDCAFVGVSAAVDHFCAVDGKPINMVWLRNGTTFMNTVVEMFGSLLGEERSAGFSAVIPQVLAAPTDCGGILALPFMDDEPGLGVRRGGTALLAGLNPENTNPGNVVKAALLSTMFNLRAGCEVLDAQGFPRKELILSGGLVNTPELGQVLADVFRTPVTVLEGAEEGTAWGAALLAKFRQSKIQNENQDWPAFLASHADTRKQCYEPNQKSAEELNAVYTKYKKLMEIHSPMDEALA